MTKIGDARLFASRRLDWYRSQSRALRITLPALLVGGLLVGAGITVAATPAPTQTSEYKALSAKRDSIQEDYDNQTQSVSDLQAEVADQKTQLDELQSQADDYDARVAAVKQREDAVAKREAAVSKTEKAQKANSFEDGTFVVGTDIQPGTYKTSGGDGCYWARLSDLSGSLGGIITNDNASGPVTVTIAASDKGFESSRCGTWTKVG